MKKLMLSAAVCGLALAASAPARADDGGVHLDLGGYMKLYGLWLDQDTAVGSDERAVDLTRDTEIHLTGETTLDNGLTVGAHFEMEADADGGGSGSSDSFGVQESYAYLAGGWGRLNVGAEDGAGYLLQVAAPSADENIDGIRQYINPVNYELANADIAGLADDTFLGTVNTIIVDTGAAGASAGDIRVANTVTTAALFRYDYDMALSAYDQKLTYLTPVYNGFQAGFSYTPDLGNGDRFNHSGIHSAHDEDGAGDYGDVWELSARYEGQWNELGIALGGGYAHATLEDPLVILYRDNTAGGTYTADDDIVSEFDDREAWNAGVDFDWGPFGLGVAYMEDDLGLGDGGDQETWTVGVDYTTGPFKLGASYYNQDQETFALSGVSGEVETDRWTGGVVYTYGPGMTFRGSISYVDHELPAHVDTGTDLEATSVLLGTQINF